MQKRERKRRHLLPGRDDGRRNDDSGVVGSRAVGGRVVGAVRSGLDRDAEQLRWFEPINLLFGAKYTTYDLTQLSSTCWTLIQNRRLPIAVDELLSDSDVFVDEEWFVFTPAFLVSEGRYRGNVVIDLADNESEIALGDFCSALQMAMVYHRDHIDQTYDPSPQFTEIDRFVSKHSAPGS